MIEDRYQEQQHGGLRYGIIEVTTKCECRCPGCYMVKRGLLGKGMMTLEQAVRALDLCRDFCGRELETMDLLGGDPLLWPHLRPYLEVLIGRGIAPWVFTNMIAITPELARWLFERRINVTGKLNIGDPSDPEQLALQATMIGRGPEAVRRMIDGITVFTDAGYRDPLFRLQNLIRKANLHLVPDFIRYCLGRGIGVDLELMGSGEPVGPEYWKVAPTPEQLAGMVRELERQGTQSFAGSAEKYFRYPCRSILMPHVFGSCPFYDTGLYFAVDGSIRACSNSTQQLSSVTDPDPIRKAWESKLLRNRRALSKYNVGEPCGSCDRWERCRGGCRATVEGMGDPFGGYTLCPLPLLA